MTQERERRLGGRSWRSKKRALALAIVTVLVTAGEAQAAGHPWRISPAPSPPPDHRSLVSDVSCPTARFCVAVGNDFTAPAQLFETWSGHRWSLTQAAGIAARGVLFGVSCLSSSFCMAVGTVIEEWNGSTWTFIADAAMRSVSCVSPSFCMAVGFSTAPPYFPVAATWDGTRWGSLNPAGASDTQLYRVSCPIETFCVAVGVAGHEPIEEQWDGATWNLMKTPVFAAQNAALYGVSCESTTFCMADGYQESAGVATTLIERWDGTSWRVMGSPNPGPFPNGGLSGVSCEGDRLCMAVGLYKFQGPVFDTLVERWDGRSWTIDPSGNPPGGGFNWLVGVSCPRKSLCVAAGVTASDASLSDGRPLLETS